MKKTLDSNAIKLVAIAAMTVDHVAWWLFPGYPRACCHWRCISSVG